MQFSPCPPRCYNGGRALAAGSENSNRTTVNLPQGHWEVHPGVAAHQRDESKFAAGLLLGLLGPRYFGPIQEPGQLARIPPATTPGGAYFICILCCFCRGVTMFHEDCLEMQERSTGMSNVPAWMDC